MDIFVFMLIIAIAAVLQEFQSGDVSFWIAAYTGIVLAVNLIMFYGWLDKRGLLRSSPWPKRVFMARTRMSVAEAQRELNEEMRRVMDNMASVSNPQVDPSLTRTASGQRVLDRTAAVLEGSRLEAKMSQQTPPYRIRLDDFHQIGHQTLQAFIADTRDAFARVRASPFSADLGSSRVASGVLRSDPPRAADILENSRKAAERNLAEARLAAARAQRRVDGHFSVDEINQQENAELRGAMLEKYGLERYMADVGAKVIARDVYGELLEYLESISVARFTAAEAREFGISTLASVRRSTFSTANIVVLPDGSYDVHRVTRRVRAVRVLNSTPDWPPGPHLVFPRMADGFAMSRIQPIEPEHCKHDSYEHNRPGEAICNGCGCTGTFRTYVLRVPPNMNTPREAIAWTFGLQAHEYEPELMT